MRHCAASAGQGGQGRTALRPASDNPQGNVRCDTAGPRPVRGAAAHRSAAGFGQSPGQCPMQHCAASAGQGGSGAPLSGWLRTIPRAMSDATLRGIGGPAGPAVHPSAAGFGHSPGQCPMRHCGASAGQRGLGWSAGQRWPCGLKGRRSGSSTPPARQGGRWHRLGQSADSARRCPAAWRYSGWPGWPPPAALLRPGRPRPRAR